MDWYAKIKSFYDRKLWSAEQVKIAVEKEKITQEQYKEITGTDYAA